MYRKTFMTERYFEIKCSRYVKPKNVFASSSGEMSYFFIQNIFSTFRPWPRPSSGVVHTNDWYFRYHCQKSRNASPFLKNIILFWIWIINKALVKRVLSLRVYFLPKGSTYSNILDKWKIWLITPGLLAKANKNSHEV